VVCRARSLRGGVQAGSESEAGKCLRSFAATRSLRRGAQAASEEWWVLGRGRVAGGQVSLTRGSSTRRRRCRRLAGVGFRGPVASPQCSTRRRRRAGRHPGAGLQWRGWSSPRGRLGGSGRTWLPGWHSAPDAPDAPDAACGLGSPGGRSDPTLGALGALGGLGCRAGPGGRGGRGGSGSKRGRPGARQGGGGRRRASPRHWSCSRSYLCRCSCSRSCSWPWCWAACPSRLLPFAVPAYYRRFRILSLSPVIPVTAGDP
jgi:hypothetical protein